MIINRNNYEIYFLDFFEGKLNAELTEELMQFLDLNYDLKEEFEAFENTPIPNIPQIAFPDKENLKKVAIESIDSITHKNYQEKMIAALEGDLSKEENDALMRFLELNPPLKKEMERFARARVEADNSIVFDNKEALKKQVSIIEYAGISSENYIDRFIAFFEGDLSEEEKLQVQEFLYINPALQKDFDLFEKAVVSPDNSIVFEGKEQLKRADIPVYTLKQQEGTTQISLFKRVLYPLSVAASLAIIISIYFSFMQSDLTEGNQTARNNQIKSNRSIVIPDIDNSQNDAMYNNYSSQHTASVDNYSDTKEIFNPERISSKGYAALAGPVKDIPKALETQETYSELYEIIRERRNSKQENTDDKPESKYYTLDQFALYNVKKTLKPKNERSKVRPDDKITLWDVADAGIRGFNNIAGTNAKLNHTENNSFSLALGDKFSVSRSKSQNK